MINLSGGSSEKDWICFHTRSNSIAAIKQEDGTIKFEIVCTKKQDTSFFKSILAIFSVFIIPSFIKTLVLIPLIKNNRISVMWYLISAFFYTIFTLILIIYTRKRNGKEFLRNHGAEHMIYAAYKKLKRIPSIQESYKFSRIAKDCGATIFSGFITAQIIGFMVYVYTQFVIPEIVLLLMPLFFCDTFPFNLIGKFAQLLTTCKPKPKNLRLAISALYALEMLEYRGEGAISALNNGDSKLIIN